jgi:hypothetical protein
MGQRFSDIRRAAKLSQQLQGYVAYLSNPRTLTRPYQARGPRTPASIVPFGGGVPTGVTALTSFENKPENVQLVADVTAAPAALITTPAAATAQQIIGLRPARVTRVTATNKVTTQPTSKYTNVEYRKYTTDRASIPFGAENAADEYLDVIKVLKGALTNPALAICWISFSPETSRFR